MTPIELTQRIRGIIRDITHKEYVRPVIVRRLPHGGWEAGFETRQYHPVWYSAELSDEDFLKFIRHELCRAGFLRELYSKAERYTGLDRRLNRLLSPYDTARTH